MGKSLGNYLAKIGYCSIVFLLITCGKDDSEFPSYGELYATINGDKIYFNADRAKEYGGKPGWLTILGRNCGQGKLMIGFDIPFSTGTFTKETLGSYDFYVNSAGACDGESGKNRAKVISEVSVTVTELTNNRVIGRFNMYVDDPNVDNDVKYTISDGYFNVEREQ